MQASVFLEVIGGVIGVSIIGLLLGLIYKLSGLGLFTFLSDSFEPLADLLGSGFTNVLISAIILIFVISLGRFILSFLGENSGSSANK